MNPLKPSLIEKNNSFFGQLLFLLVLIATGLLIFFKLNYLLSSLLGAITIYFVFRKAAFYLIEQKHWKPILVSLMIVVGTLSLVGVLAYFVVNILVGEIPVIDIQLITNNLTEFVEDINQKIGFSLISSDLISSATNFISGLASSLLDTTYLFVVNLLMMFFILYFMFMNGRSIERTLLSYAPLQGENLALMKNEIKNMVFGNAIGIPIIMIAQFIVASIGYGIAGVDRFFFFAFLTALFGPIPVIGTVLVWGPLSIYLLMSGMMWQGIFLLIYSVIFTFNMDTLCRMVLLKSITNAHPLIVIFGIILGVPLLGFWGIIFGPLILSGFFLLIKIYHLTYKND